MKAHTQNRNSELPNRSERLDRAKTVTAGACAQSTRHPPIDFRRRWRNRRLSTSRLVKLLAAQWPDLYERAEVVGRWVWVQFHPPPAPDIRRQLAELGFHWNRARQAWQHPGGAPCHFAAWGDPRRRYPSHFPADLNPF